MLFESQCWEKSTSKNVAKAYVDVQITANHYAIICEYLINIVMHGCTHTQ